MEVHHHSHTESPPDRRAGKRWTHYIWEFLMLFLAVFCGFLAENFREHYVEHQREKIFANLLYDDLKKDTALLNRIVMIKEWRNHKIDSLVYLLSLPDLEKQGTAIYYYSSFLNANFPFNANDATIQQLRNSGTLRYFRNPRLYNAITQYYSDCKFYLERESERKNEVSEELLASFFDAKDHASLITITPDIMDAVEYPVKEMHLLSVDRKLINQFLININNNKKANELSIMLLKGFLKDEQNKLIADLRTEFNLK